MFSRKAIISAPTGSAKSILVMATRWQDRSGQQSQLYTSCNNWLDYWSHFADKRGVAEFAGVNIRFRFVKASENGDGVPR
jgi:hypothetical protein